MNLLKLFRRERKLVVVRRSQSTLRLSEWRSNKPLVSAAMQIMRLADFQMMVDVLKNEHPGSTIVFREDTRLDIRAMHQARCEGYTMALANLESLGKFQAMQEPLEATFEPEEMTPTE